ncbi:hypothetical protein PQE70_gp111 [Bacillus phage vB_BanS_Nate]|uniref:Uncharacterized protein n=1 Tax=Bacillus phage vB_BanS_Nate TaxID=2894788 RepID=A0AAE9CE77_9CAUD|nr:hypothetical protein PQE70_gp111 [Bacillus phage vB_BanS_Nate]UGO50964.1 hypothetical protein NATE_111 [Bacillus phage vB_BanS_Nate]
MTKTNITLTQLELNEKPFQVDYKENLAVAFKAIEEIEMSLEKEIHNELIKELSRMDRGISDVKHIIEFYKFNAYEGYMLSKMMQELSQMRRLVKERIDERNRMMTFINTYRKLFKQPLKHQLGQQEYRQTALDSQKYELRELKHLDGYLKAIDEQKAKLKVQQEEEAYMAYKEDLQYASLQQV